jgi:hypothetical protein
MQPSPMSDYDGNSGYHAYNGELLEKILEELVKMNESLKSLVSLQEKSNNPESP